MKGLPALVLALVPALSPHAGAHEVQDNRATLVLRDGNHVSIALYVDWVAILHRALAPARPLAEFLGVYSAMKPEDLRIQLQRAQTRLQTGVRLALESGEAIPISGWVWPSVADVQTRMQTLLMRGVVDPSAHVHGDPLEIHAEAVSPTAIPGVKIRFPEEFGQVLVVAYKPTQEIVDPGRQSRPIRF